MQKRHIFLIFILSLLPGTLGATDSSFLISTLRSDHEKNGDYDQLVEDWLMLLEANPDNPAAPLMLHRLKNIAAKKVDPTLLIEPLNKIIHEKGTGGFTRELARDLLADLYRKTGQKTELENLNPDNGFILHWTIIGPFGMGARSQIHRIFPPEQEIDLQKTYQGWRREVHWKAVFRKRPRRFLNCRNYLGKGPGIYYQLSQIHAEAAQDVLLQIHSSQPVGIFINGQIVLQETDGVFMSNPRRYQMHLESGWNRLMLKSRGNSLALRLIDMEGNPPGKDQIRPEEGMVLHEPSTTVENSSESKTSGGEGPVASMVPFQWEEYFKNELAQLNDGANSDEEMDPEKAMEFRDMQLGLAMLYHFSNRSDLAVSHAEIALASSSNSVSEKTMSAAEAHRHYLAGLLLNQANHLPKNHARRRARGAFDKVLKQSSSFIPARLEQASILIGDDQPLKALEAVNKAIEHNSDCLPAHELLLNIFEERAWEPEALKTAETIRKLSSHSRVPHLYHARVSENFSNSTSALKHYRAAFKLDQSRTSLLKKIFDLESQRGNMQAARTALDAWILEYPDSKNAQFTLVQFLLDTGKHQQAIDLLSERMEKYPENPVTIKRLARALEQGGKPEKAMEMYQKAIDLNPGDISTIRYVENLKGKPFERFWEPYDEELENWTPKIPDREKFPKAGSLAVLDIAVLKLFPDGSSSEFTHQALQLLNDGAKEELAKVHTSGEIYKLRTLTPDGKTLEPVTATGNNNFVMPGLEPGAIVEFAYRNDISEFNSWILEKGSFFFQDFTYRHPMLLSRYVIIFPKNFSADLIEHAIDKQQDSRFANVQKKEESLADGGRVVIYEARDVPRMEPEVLMPNRVSYIPNVQLIEKRNWLDVANALEDTLTGRTRLTPELKQFADDTTEGIDPPLEKAKALYDKVNELITSDRGPRQAHGILLESAGDRNILYKALLDAADIPSSWAHARPHEKISPAMDLDYPRTSLFTGRLIAVEPPGHSTFWVTLKARHAPFGKIPYFYQGGKALLFQPKSTPLLLSIPRPPQERSGDFMQAKMKLGTRKKSSTEGSPPLGARVTLKLTSNSFRSYEQKPLFENLDTHRRGVFLSRMGSALFPGARVSSSSLPGIEKRGTPLVIELDLEAPEVLQPAEEEYLLRALTSPLQLVQSYIRTPKREHPYHLHSQVVKRDSIEIDPGKHFRFLRLPEGTIQFCPIGSFSLRYQLQGNILHVERVFILEPGELSLETFPQLLDFCKAVDEAESERVVLKAR